MTGNVRRWVGRVLMAAAVAYPTLIAAGADSPGQAIAASDERPNFVTILVDDLDQTTSPYWKAMPKTAERSGTGG